MGRRHPPPRRVVSWVALVLCAAATTALARQPTASPVRWRTLPDLPRPLAGHATGVSRGAVIVAGGTDFPTSLFQGGAKAWLDRAYVLEPSQSTWRETLRLPHAVAYAAAATVDHTLVVAGGSDGTRHTVDVFGLEWTGHAMRRHELPPLPAPIAMAGAAALGRTLFVVGGQATPNATAALRTVWALDLSASPATWRALPPLPGPGRILPVVAAQEGRLLVFSGADLHQSADGASRRQYLTDAYAWDSASGWRRIADVPHPVVAAPAAPVGPSHVMVLGGDTGRHADRVAELKDAHPGFSRTILAYQTITDTWTEWGLLPVGLVTTTAVTVDDAIVVAGGEDRPGHRSAAVLAGTPGRASPPNAAIVSAVERDRGVELRQTDVYVAGTGGYHTYRIPSVIATQKGTLLAFAEGRRADAADAGDIDLVLRRSRNGGASWLPLQIVGDNGPNTFGNPCPVVDTRTGVIWLLATQNLGVDREKDIVAGTSQASRTVWVMKSGDDGVTWSAPLEITSSVKEPAWTWYATGPGIGIQTRSGRLVIPANHAEAGTGVHRSHLFYSDDGGVSWTLGGSSDVGTNESQVVELADGRLMLNMRNHPPKAENVRMVATSADGGRTLEPAHPDRALVEPPAQAALVRFSPANARDRTRLLFANPASTRRERLTVRVSEDEGASWMASRVVHDGPSAYSSLVVLPDRSIGLLYERGERSPYERIAFGRFPLEWITENSSR